MNAQNQSIDSAKLILGSASPRRRKLLARLPVSFVVIPSTREEPALNQQDAHRPEEVATSIASFKAFNVSQAYPEHWVLGADTLVACQGEMLGKPIDRGDAERMLLMQAREPSIVITGLALVRQQPTLTHIQLAERTTVWMRSNPSLRNQYLDGEDWRDKAGAYGIQSVGDELVERIEGSFSNVVGLPVERVAELLVRVGIITQSSLSELDLNEHESNPPSL